jgi:IS605 OrfB family transposase
MKLIAQVKLQPHRLQRSALRRTLEEANAAANFVSETAWNNQSFKQFDLHHACYYAVREQFQLAAQVAVRTIAKVADAYKLDKKTQREFRPLGSIAYDERILRWYPEQRIVSIWTVKGREKISFVAGEKQLAMLQTRQGEADLVYRNGEFYLYQTCDVDEQDPKNAADFLGVDMGVVNLATTSDGANYTGTEIEASRQWFQKRRDKLQSIGTKSAKRRLRKLSGKQARFQKHTNHAISKQIVSKAKDTSRGIAIENLNGIRERTRFRRQQRAKQSNWSFYQLRQFIEYKAKLLGVWVVQVDPRNTSKGCSQCGHVADSNRLTRDDFRCCNCGYAAPADYNAALNIRARASLRAPMVSIA